MKFKEIKPFTEKCDTFIYYNRCYYNLIDYYHEFDDYELVDTEVDTLDPSDSIYSHNIDSVDYDKHRLIVILDK